MAIYSVEADNLERSVSVDEPVTDSIWDGPRIFFSTAKGSVKVFESGSEIASFTEHAGPATGLAIHPSKAILASVGADKSFVFYDLQNLQRATRVYTNAGKFHRYDYTHLRCEFKLIFVYSFDGLCIPPRRSPLRCRHRRGRDQALHD